MREEVVLVTTTFSKSVDDLRFRLALKTVKAAGLAGYPIIVVDGSPSEVIGETLRESGARVFKQHGTGMGASRRQCIQAGLDTGAQVIVWLEPEKHTIVGELAPCIEMVRSGYDIVVSTRRSLESYPMYQELSELRANREIGMITGRHDLDLMSGPRIMSRVGAKLLLAYKGERGDNWEILFIPVLRALKLGKKVGSCVVEYIHPPEQTAAEAGDEAMDRKRDQQRHNLVSAMLNEAEAIDYKRA